MLFYYVLSWFTWFTYLPSLCLLPSWPISLMNLLKFNCQQFSFIYPFPYYSLLFVILFWWLMIILLSMSVWCQAGTSFGLLKVYCCWCAHSKFNFVGLCFYLSSSSSLEIFSFPIPRWFYCSAFFYILFTTMLTRMCFLTQPFSSKKWGKKISCLHLFTSFKWRILMVNNLQALLS